MAKLYVARDREDCPYVSHHLRLYLVKPVRSIEDGLWHTDDWEYPESELLPLPEELFPNLKWEDEPIEVVITEKPNLSLSVTRKEIPDDTIVLTRYYENYEKEHEWFVNMLKHQERYKDCTDEEVEEIWKNHIKEEYTIDEIWDTIQCDGYTKISLRMGRHDNQPDYDYVLEAKEYIDEKMKNYR